MQAPDQNPSTDSQSEIPPSHRVRVSPALNEKTTWKFSAFGWLDSLPLALYRVCWPRELKCRLNSRCQKRSQQGRHIRTGKIAHNEAYSVLSAAS